MSLNNVRAFYERLINDEDFRGNLQKSQSPEESGQIINEGGYSFTQEEFEAFTAELVEQNTEHEYLRDLGEQELEAVFGGISSALRIFPWPIMMYGAVFTYLL